MKSITITRKIEIYPVGEKESRNKSFHPALSFFSYNEYHNLILKMSNYFQKEDEIIISVKALLLKERSKYRYVRNKRSGLLPNGWNEVLKKDFVKALPRDYEPEQVDVIIEQLISKGVILKVEGVIIHLNEDLAK